MDLREFTEVTFSGYNENGYVQVEVDYDTIAAMLGDRNTFSAMAVLNSIKPASVENNGQLSNGDKIKVKINCNESVLKEANLAVQNTELEFTVSGLEERAELDVFKDVEITVENYSPFCQVTAVYNGGVKCLQGSSFNKTDANGEAKEYFSDNETVRLTLSEGVLQNPELGKYKIKELSHDFTVSCGDRYITGQSSLDAEQSKALDKLAEDCLNDDNKKIIESGTSTSYWRTSFIKRISGKDVGSAKITGIDNIKLNSKYIGATNNPAAAFAPYSREPVNCAYYFYDLSVTFDWKYFTSSGTETVDCCYVIYLKNPVITSEGLEYADFSVTGYANYEDAYANTVGSSKELEFEKIG